MAPASANREYRPTPLSFGSAFAVWMAALSFVDPVDVGGEVMMGGDGGAECERG